MLSLFHLLHRKHFIIKWFKAHLLPVSCGGTEDLVGIMLMACLHVVYDAGICCLWMLNLIEILACSVCWWQQELGCNWWGKKEKIKVKIFLLYLLVHCRMGQAKLHERVRPCAVSECGLFPCTWRCQGADSDPWALAGHRGGSRDWVGLGSAAWHHPFNTKCKPQCLQKSWQLLSMRLLHL